MLLLVGWRSSYVIMLRRCVWMRGCRLRRWIYDARSDRLLRRIVVLVRSRYRKALILRILAVSSRLLRPRNNANVFFAPPRYLWWGRVVVGGDLAKT